MFKTLKNSILHFLFPQKCIGCGTKKVVLCPKCLHEIGYPLKPKDKNIFAAADYKDPVSKKAIWLLKYHGVKIIAKSLAELITRRIDRVNITKDYIIIPIPLSKKRYRERGFNQAELLAKELCQQINQKKECVSVKILFNVLYKKIHTDTQVSIKDKQKRLENTKGVFVVKNHHLIKNQNVMLIDDVATTGGTITEASKTLRSAGAKKVIAYVVAHG